MEARPPLLHHAKDLWSQLLHEAQKHEDHQLAGALKQFSVESPLSDEACTLLIRSLHNSHLNIAGLSLRILSEISKVDPQSVLNTQGIGDTIKWLLDHPLQGHTHDLVASGLEMLSAFQHQKVGNEGPDCEDGTNLEEILKEPVIISVCHVLSKVVKRSSLADVRVGCCAVRVLIFVIKLGSSSLLGILAGAQMLTLILGLLKVAYQLPSLILLQASNELLECYCKADEDEQEDLCLMVFENEIALTDNGQSRDAAAECLFWINVMSVSAHQSVLALRSIVWIGRYKILARLNQYLQRVWCEEDHNWFLICANTYPCAFLTVLENLAALSPSVPASLLSGFQNELLESGLLDNTHRFMRGFVSLLKQKGIVLEGRNDQSRCKTQEHSTLALAVLNTYRFYFRCLEGNPNLCQYSEVCDSFELMVSTLMALEEFLKACNDPNTHCLCSQTQGTVLGVLCNLMEQKLGHAHPEQWPVDAEHIRKEIFLEVINFIGHNCISDSVPEPQIKGVMVKTMELLHYMMQYASQVIAHFHQDLYSEIQESTRSAMNRLKPQLNKLLQVEIERCTTMATSILDDISIYRDLLATKP